jgi:hypothetical protein
MKLKTLVIIIIILLMIFFALNFSTSEKPKPKIKGDEPQHIKTPSALHSIKDMKKVLDQAKGVEKLLEESKQQRLKEDENR